MQGLFFYIFYVASTIGRVFRGRPKSVHSTKCKGAVSAEGLHGLCPHFARHHLGTTKPWLIAELAGLNKARVAAYVTRVRYQHLLNTSRCARHFASTARRLHHTIAAQQQAESDAAASGKPKGAADGAQHLQQIR